MRSGEGENNLARGRVVRIKNILLVNAAQRHIIVSLPQAACSAISRGFDPYCMAGSHWCSNFFRWWILVVAPTMEESGSCISSVDFGSCNAACIYQMQYLPKQSVYTAIINNATVLRYTIGNSV